MNFEQNFRFIGAANVDALQELVAKLSDDSWQAGAIDKRPADIHGDTRSLLLVYDHDLRHAQPTRQPAMQIFGQVLRPLLAVTAEHYDKSETGLALAQQHGAGYFIRARLIAIPAGGGTASNTDDEYSLLHSHLIHVPVITHAGVTTKVGDESLHLPEGEIFELNNARPYSLRNEGEHTACHLELYYVLKGEAPARDD